MWVSGACQSPERGQQKAVPVHLKAGDYRATSTSEGGTRGSNTWVLSMTAAGPGREADLLFVPQELGGVGQMDSSSNLGI